MKKISVKFGHSNMWPNGQNEGVKHHLIDGVCIEANYDGGNWWVEEVSIDGEIAKTYLTHKKHVSFRKDTSFMPETNTKPKRILTQDHIAKLQAARRNVATKAD